MKHLKHRKLETTNLSRGTAVALLVAAIVMLVILPIMSLARH